VQAIPASRASFASDVQLFLLGIGVDDTYRVSPGITGPARWAVIPRGVAPTQNPLAKFPGNSLGSLAGPILAELVSCTECGAPIEDEAEVCGACGSAQAHARDGADGPSPAAGWYADPDQPGGGRYWDGQNWTEQRATTPSAGWYADPGQPGGRRYWDGEGWTEERTSAIAQDADAEQSHLVNVQDAGDRGDEEPTRVAEPPRRRRALSIAVVVLALAGGAGVGAYFVGRSTGEDLDAARAAGAAAGQREGAAKGAQQGYAEGFKAGREKGYEQTYDEAYKAAYRKAYEDAGLTAPEKVSVPQNP
jgi:hypothetical protein